MPSEMIAVFWIKTALTVAIGVPLCIWFARRHARWVATHEPCDACGGSGWRRKGGAR